MSGLFQAGCCLTPTPGLTVPPRCGVSTPQAPQSTCSAKQALGALGRLPHLPLRPVPWDAGQLMTVGALWFERGEPDETVPSHPISGPLPLVQLPQKYIAIEENLSQ